MPEENQCVDDKFYTGVQEAPRDPEERIYDDYVVMAGEIEIDWKRGYDVRRDDLKGHIEYKDQKKSLSCVGQGWSYYIWVYQVLEMMKKYGMTLEELRIHHPKEVEEISAKAIYSQIFLDGGGAYVYAGGKLVINWGAVFDRLVPSRKPDGSVDETFMRDKSWLTEEITKIAELLKGKEYRIIRAKANMNLYAQAIIQNKGVVGAIRGQNGRGWGDNERPMPPRSLAQAEWSHLVYFGAFGEDSKGKFIATPNSWGRMTFNKDYRWKQGDPVGKGWQKLYEDYFTNDFQFDPWTYTDILNPNQDDMANPFVRVVKDAKSPAVGFFLPAHSPETIRNMARLYGKEVPLKEDGSLDWDKFIEGSVNFEEPLNP